MTAPTPPTPRRNLAPIAWPVAALAIVVVAAILAVAVGAMGPNRSAPAYAGDADASAALDVATARLHHLDDDVAALSADARRALSAVLAGDPAGLEVILSAGITRLGAIADDRTSFAAAIAAVPGTGAGRETRLSPPVIARYDALGADGDLGKGLEVEWTELASGARQAVTLAALLRRHDTETATAATLGTEAKYAEASVALDTPQATLVEAGKLRDALISTTDVATLTTWLDANAIYDAALRALYVALVASGGTVNDAVRAAAATETAARAGLPTDARAMTVVMSDVTHGGVNPHVIAITKARTAIEAAITALAGPASPSPAAS